MRLLAAALLPWGAAALFLPALSAYSGGPPVRRTGAPGDRTCLDAHCHAGPRFDASPAISLDNSAGLSFRPGGPRQRWRIRIDDPAARAFGLQLTVRAARDLRRSPSGDLHAVEALTSVICEDDRFKGALPCVPEAPVQFFHHTEARARGEFLLEWQPPAEPADLAVFIAANASVAGQRNARIHLREFVLRPEAGPAALHAVTGLPEIGPGAWASLYGLDFPPTAEWTVLVEGRPTIIGGRDRRQLNFLVPPDGAPGLTPLSLLRDGILAAELLVWHRRLAPAFFPAATEFSSGGEMALYATGLGETLELRLDGRVIDAGRARVAPGVERLVATLPALPPGAYPLIAVTDGVPVANAPVLALR